MSRAEGKPVTISEQAAFLDLFVVRCSMHDGEIAEETTKVLSRDDVVFIRGIADRLARMAPHENEIRSIVTGRR